MDFITDKWICRQVVLQIHLSVGQVDFLTKFDPCSPIRNCPTPRNDLVDCHGLTARNDLVDCHGLTARITWLIVTDSLLEITWLIATVSLLEITWLIVMESLLELPG